MLSTGVGLTAPATVGRGGGGVFPPALPWTETFTGADGAVANTNFWITTIEDPAGSVELLGNKLKTRGPTSNVGATNMKIDSVFTLQGDFDIEVAYSDILFPSNDSTTSSNWLYITGAVGVCYVNAWNPLGSGPQIRYRAHDGSALLSAYSASGRFRIVRTGSSVALYHYDNVEAETLGKTDASYGTGDVTCRIATNHGAVASSESSCLWDNFKINSADNVVWE